MEKLLYFMEIEYNSPVHTFPKFNFSIVITVSGAIKVQIYYHSWNHQQCLKWFPLIKNIHY